MTDIKIKLGKRIAEIRKAKGITQVQLSERTGLERTYLSKIEKGKYSAGIETIELICNALGHDIDIVERLPIK